MKDTERKVFGGVVKIGDVVHANYIDHSGARSYWGVVIGFTSKKIRIEVNGRKELRPNRDIRKR